MQKPFHPYPTLKFEPAHEPPKHPLKIIYRQDKCDIVWLLHRSPEGTYCFPARFVTNREVPPGYTRHGQIALAGWAAEDLNQVPKTSMFLHPFFLKLGFFVPGPLSIRLLRFISEQSTSHIFGTALTTNAKRAIKLL
jgi:hypothetical protein